MTQQDRPLRIGFGACFFHADPMRAIFKGKTLLYVEQSMANMVMVQGARVYMLPQMLEGTDPKEFIEEFDGILLQGGSDVSPLSYGETPLKPEWSGDRVRDIYESALLKAAMELNRPVFGACRGLQIMNVALGGSLYQDIQTQLEGTLNHRNWDIYDEHMHSIRFSENAWMRRAYPGVEGGVINSIHHQSIKDLAPHCIVEAISDTDDIIEAIRYVAPGADPTKDEIEYPYVYSVQWHPEFIRADDERQLPNAPLMVDFLDACRRRREARES